MNPYPLTPILTTYLMTKMKSIALSGFRSYPLACFIFTDDELKALNSLKEDENIVIVKPEKVLALFYLTDPTTAMRCLILLVIETNSVNQTTIQLN